AARRTAAMELDAAPASHRKSGFCHGGADHSKIPAAAGRMDPTDSRSASRIMRVRALARAYEAGPSKVVTLVPRRKGRPVLTQIRKNHRIVGADNLDPHKHLAVEPDLAREVSGQRVGDFVV